VKGSSPLLLALGLSALVASAVAVGCRGQPNAVLTDIAEARRLAADLRVQFNKASNASDRAVMADTDEDSIAYARQADQMKKLVAADTAALTPVLQRLGYADEIKALDSFGASYAEYEKLDRPILELAVENTNLKAQRLSFGPEQEAVSAFADALGASAAGGPAKNRCRVDALVAKAVLSVREIQVLQAPHIAESDDAAMLRLEQEMNALDAAAKDAVKTLSGLVDAAGRQRLAAATAALDRFENISSQIVKLSRRNSNVRSLALSLRQKPLAAAHCDEKVNALQEALAKEGFSATR
jgi:hypothetical protein